MTLPAAIFLVDAARRRLGLRDLPAYVSERWGVYAALVVVAAALLAARVLVLGSVARPLGPLGADLLEEIPRVWTLAEVWSHYARLMVFPLDLSADYSPNVIPISVGWNAANTVGATLALGMLAAAWATWRRPALGPGSESAKVVGFGVVWFLVTVSPVANVVFMTGVLLAERTLYLPSVGAAAALGWLVVQFSRQRPRAAWILLAVGLSMAALRTWTRNPDWKDNDAVFGTMIEDYPHSGRSQWALGDRFIRLGNRSQGLLSYRAAIDMLGPHYLLVVEIARKLLAMDEHESARVLLRWAWRAHPEYSVAPGLLAVISSERADPVETERWSRIALELNDEDAIRYHLLAWALATQGRWQEAAQARRGAIAHGEGDSWQQWVSLAQIEIQLGDTAAARAALDSAGVKARGTGAEGQVEGLYRMLLGDPGAAEADAGGAPAPSPPGIR